jgi:copper transport protein
MAARALFRRLAVVLACCAGLCVLAAAPAAAHAELAWSNPADGSTVLAAPAALELHLTEPVELTGTTLSIVDSAGHGLGSGPVRLARTGTGAVLVVPLPALAADTYRVSWSTVSSDDLHPTAGTLVFGVRRAVTPAEAALPPDPLPGGWEVVTQVAVYAGVAGWLGCLVLLAQLEFGGVAAGVRRSTARRLTRAAVGSVGLAFAGGVALLLSRAAVFDGDAVRNAVTLLSATSVGPPWLVRQCAFLAMAAVVVVAARYPAVRRAPLFVAAGAFAGMVAVTTTLLGHLSVAGPAWVVTDALHVLATLAWAGTVIAAATVLVTARGAAARRATRVVLRRFGLFATVALTVVVATGVLLAGNRVASVDALLLSTYGRTLLVKVGLAAAAALVGLASTLTLHSRRWGTTRGGARPSARTVRVVLAEAAVLSLVLLVTAGLVSTHQVNGPLWRAQQNVAASRSGTSATAHDLVQTLSVRPNLPGRNFVALDVYDTRRPAPEPIQAVTVTLRGPAGRSVTRTAVPSGGSSYLLTTEDLDSAGEWAITVTALRRYARPAGHTYTWLVPPPTTTSRQVRVSAAPLTPYTPWLAVVAVLAGSVAVGVVVARRRARAGVSSRGRSPGG